MATDREDVETGNFLLNEFLARYSEAEFPNREVLFDAIQSGSCHLHWGGDSTSKPLSGSHYLRIYAVREQLLGRRNTFYAQQRRQEIAALLRELEKTPDELVQLWIFLLAGDSAVVVFVGITSRRILGCTQGMDQRLADPEKWDRFWGDRPRTT